MIRKLYYTIFSVLLILFLMYGCMKSIFSSMCGNQLVNQIESPNRQYKAVIFTRDCGATTGFSTHVSLMKTSDKLENNPGNIFIASGREAVELNEIGGPLVIAQWTNNSELLIEATDGIEISE